VAAAGNGEAAYYGAIQNDPEAIGKTIRRIVKKGNNAAFCYEAGPCGYGIYRQIRDMGYRCDVVAPSLIPRKTGDRVKTDRRDSLSLARLYRAGELTPVQTASQCIFAQARQEVHRQEQMDEGAFQMA
jgi:transposase